MGIFKRLFKIGQAEAHSVVDKLEDPIKLTEQGIRDMKVDLDNALKALAEVKALAIRTRNETNVHKAKVTEYEQKAMMLLQRAQQGAIAPEEADRLASVALTKKEESVQLYNRSAVDQKKLEEQVAKLEVNVRTLRTNISKWENESRALKARAKVSEATVNVNKQLANIDSTSTIAMLERMKEKVEKQEALSDAYADMADSNKSVDEELDSVLGTTSNDALSALKAKMGITAGDNPPTVPPTI